MVSADKDFKLGIPRDDCVKMLSVLCHQEKARRKKIRFLERLHSKSGGKKRRWTVKLSEDYKRKLKIPKCMLESFIRTVDAPFSDIETYKESSVRVSSENQGEHHVVQEYLQLFDIYNTEPAKFFRILRSALNSLKLDRLNQVAQITTGNKNAIERTPTAMKFFVENNIPEMLMQAECQNHSHSEAVKQLSIIFKDPSNFQKHLTLITIVTPSLLSSITKVLQDLDTLPIQCLVAMDRKISDLRIIPEFSVNPNCRREVILKRLRKKICKVLSKLKEGNEVPKPLAKALSVISLHNKQVTGQVDMPTTEFFPFTPEAQVLQMEILTAIWSLPKMKLGKLKLLQHLLDPNAQLSRVSFRIMVKKYLMDHLFESCEMDAPIPKKFLRVVAFINRKSTQKCKKQNIDEELEAVLNVSSQLRQILWDSAQDYGIDRYMEGYGNEDDNDGGDDDIVIDNFESDSFFGEHDTMQHHASFLDVQAERVDESEDVYPVAVANKMILSQKLETESVTSTDEQVPKFEPGAALNDCEPCPSMSSEPNPHGKKFLCKRNDSTVNGYRNIQNICDETSLLAHGLISHVMEKFQGVKMPNNSEKRGLEFLTEATEELLPSFSKSGIENVKAFMQLLQS